MATGGSLGGLAHWAARDCSFLPQHLADTPGQRDRLQRLADERIGAGLLQSHERGAGRQRCRDDEPSVLRFQRADAGRH